ncbi:hypothetical protein FQN54_007744 [Arachnomyces sp. PD_36]|nr:hypothetical protein FQN54_007744 [Arachnomyces sp. PD_36]
MPMNWNDQADAKLLIGIIKTAKPKIDYDALAAYMGEGCTAYGIQHRIRKIQAKANESGDSAPSTPSKAAGGTPKGKKAPTPRKTPAKKTPKRKGAKEETASDEEECASPTKKVKSEVVKEEDDVKDEVVSEGELA